MICGFVLSLVILLLYYNKKSIIEHFVVNKDNIKRINKK